MLKKLFYAVLGFWLLKKYVLPRFRTDNDTVPDESI
jgi:hypothetical protein